MSARPDHPNHPTTAGLTHQSRALLEDGAVIFHPGFVAVAQGHLPTALLLAGLVAEQLRQEENGVIEWHSRMAVWRRRLGMGSYQVRQAFTRLRSLNLLTATRSGGERPGFRLCLEWDAFVAEWHRQTGTPFKDWYAGPLR